MKQKKYYDLSRKQGKKNRKKMMKALNKNGYKDEEILRIVDVMAGDTPYGKELTAGDILNMLEAGARKEEVTAYVESLTQQSFLHPLGD